MDRYTGTPGVRPTPAYQISSALDVRTEQALWDRLSSIPGATCLAVSHRPLALQRADRIVVLSAGRVEAAGPLAHVLEHSPTFREIWARAQTRSEA